MNKTIIENGIEVYKYHFCEHCNKRIPVKKSHKLKGIPKCIKGHSGHKFKKGHNFVGKKGYHLSAETIQKQSIAKSGKNNPNYEGNNGFKNSEENYNFVDGYGHERWRCKHRKIGFCPLNKKTRISNTMHHLSDRETVIFEPKEFHDACYHGRGCSKEYRKMADAIALMWYSIEWFHLHGISID